MHWRCLGPRWLGEYQHPWEECLQQDEENYIMRSFVILIFAKCYISEQTYWGEDVGIAVETLTMFKYWNIIEVIYMVYFVLGILNSLKGIPSKYKSYTPWT
jgi:hypothetical protein